MKDHTRLLFIGKNIELTNNAIDVASVKSYDLDFQKSRLASRHALKRYPKREGYISSKMTVTLCATNPF